MTDDAPDADPAAAEPPATGAVAGDGDGDEGDETTDDDRPRFVLATVGGGRVLVPVESALEVLIGPSVTRLPGSRPAVMGVTSVRGRIVAVVDPRAALDPIAAETPVERPRLPGDGHLLVVPTADGPVAVAVDHVHAVVPADLHPADDPAPAPPGRDGRATLDDGTTLDVVDPAAVLAIALGHVTGADLDPAEARP